MTKTIWQHRQEMIEEALRREEELARQWQQRKAASAQRAVDGDGSVPSLLGTNAAAQAVKSSLFNQETGLFLTPEDIEREARDNAIAAVKAAARGETEAGKEAGEPEVKTKEQQLAELKAAILKEINVTEAGQWLKSLSDKPLPR